MNCFRSFKNGFSLKDFVLFGSFYMKCPHREKGLGWGGVGVRRGFRGCGVRARVGWGRGGLGFTGVGG